MPFVLDASITVTWALPGESHPVAEAALQALRNGEYAFVPGIWWYEVRNIFVVNERRKRISPPASVRFLEGLQNFDITIHTVFDNAEVLVLARSFGLTVYDAAYLALAKREGIPIATLDKALQTAATAAGIPLLV